MGMGTTIYHAQLSGPLLSQFFLYSLPSSTSLLTGFFFFLSFPSSTSPSPPSTTTSFCLLLLLSSSKLLILIQQASQSIQTLEVSFFCFFFLCTCMEIYVSSNIYYRLARTYTYITYLVSLILSQQLKLSCGKGGCIFLHLLEILERCHEILICFERVSF